MIFKIFLPAKTCNLEYFKQLTLSSKKKINKIYFTVKNHFVYFNNLRMKKY